MVDFIESVRGTLMIILQPYIDRIQNLKKYGFKIPQKDPNLSTNQRAKTERDSLITPKIQFRKSIAVIKRREFTRKKTFFKAEDTKKEEEQETSVETESVAVDDNRADVEAAIEERYQVIKKKAQEFYDVLFANELKFRTKKDLIESGLKRQQNRVAFELAAKVAKGKISQGQGEETVESDVGASKSLLVTPLG